MSELENRWGDSGLAWLTGTVEQPDFSRAAVLARADRAAESIGRLLGVKIDAAMTLTGRAALAGLSRRGRISAGGASRLMRSRDGWWALTLSRTHDREAVPALIQSDRDIAADPWADVQQWARSRDSGEILERCRLLDLPAALLDESSTPALARRQIGPTGNGRSAAGLLVADLTAMWAGPLCGRILAAAGAVVIKVESPSRADGTRRGEPAFFDLVNAGKLSYAIDFDRDEQRLRRLLSAADVVLEGSRPRAMARRGLTPFDMPGPAGRVWMRLTGYGPDSDRAAFGDDAAVAGGLVGRTPAGPVFCADAVADPLTGMQAALAIAESVSRGGGELLDISMAGVAADYAAMPPGGSISSAEVLPPKQPPPSAPGPALGAHNEHVEQLISERLSTSC